jgi:hypothetical protein
MKNCVLAQTEIVDQMEEDSVVEVLVVVPEYYQVKWEVLVHKLDRYPWKEVS